MRRDEHEGPEEKHATRLIRDLSLEEEQTSIKDEDATICSTYDDYRVVEEVGYQLSLE